MKYLYLFLLITSCGKPLAKAPNYITDPYLESIAAEVMTACNLKTTKKMEEVDFQWDSEIEHSGLCIVYSDGTRVILINEKMKQETELYLKKLMAHEIGHCYFDTKHSKDPTSVMYPKLNWYPSFYAATETICADISQ